MEFEWDVHNLFHISMHGVSQQEAEEALQGKTLFIEATIRGGEIRNLYAGMTTNGRILALVVTPRGAAIRVVTAFTANKRIRVDYLARKGEQQ